MGGLLRGTRRALLAARATYTDKVLGYGPIGYWPMTERSGTTIADVSGTGAHATTPRDIAVMGVGTGIGDGNTAPLFDGVNDGVTNFGPALDGIFNGEEVTFFTWARAVNAGVWTDGVNRYFCRFMETNGNNFFAIFRQGLVNNRIDWIYDANAVVDQVQSVALAGSTAWFTVAVTASRTADEMKAYINGAQVGLTQNGLGNWDESGNMVVASTNIMSSVAAPAGVWDGYAAHAILFDSALGAVALLDLSTVP